MGSSLLLLLLRTTSKTFKEYNIWRGCHLSPLLADSTSYGLKGDRRPLIQPCHVSISPPRVHSRRSLLDWEGRMAEAVSEGNQYQVRASIDTWIKEGLYCASQNTQT